MGKELDVLRAHYRFQSNYTRVTPLLHSECLSRLIEGRVMIKAECLQRTGAFKFRGALSRLNALSEQEKFRGVIAYSSGNFARGLAAAGNILGVKVHLVMPSDAPSNKIGKAQSEGASITLCEDSAPSREEAASQLASRLAAEHQYFLLHPFDDPLIIQGQAAMALELMNQLSGSNIDSLLCPTGGGSLVSGSSLALSLAGYNTRVFAVEPEGYNSMQQSLLYDQRVRSNSSHHSSCDALQARMPGAHNFAIAQQTDVQSLTVSEKCVIEAMKLAFSELKLILEPSGAIGLGAVMEYPEKFSGQTIVIFATGGNVDPELYCQLLQSQLMQSRDSVAEIMSKPAVESIQ